MIHWSFTRVRLNPDGNPVAPYIHIDWFRSQKAAISSARLLYVD